MENLQEKIELFFHKSSHIITIFQVTRKRWNGLKKGPSYVVDNEVLVEKSSQR